MTNTEHIKTAQDMCEHIVLLLEQNGYVTNIVNNVHTEDSVVEHVIDVDFEDVHREWNMSINMNRWAVK